MSDVAEKKLSQAEIEELRKLRLEAMHLQDIEGNPFDAEDIAMFEMFEREGCSAGRRPSVVNQCRAEEAFLRWNDTRSRSWLWWLNNLTSPWRRPSPNCANAGYGPARVLSHGFSNATASPSKKKNLRAEEQHRADVAQARRRWMREQGMFDPARLVFIDETAVTTKMVRLYGRSPRGVELIGRAPFGKWETVTFVAALRHNKMAAPMVIDGAMNAEMFLAYV